MHDGAPERTGLPRSEEAETAILGAMIRNGSLAKITRLDKSDFYSERHVSIFEAIQHIASSGGIPEIVSISERLRATRTLQLSGGDEYLMELSDGCVSVAGWEQWEKIVKQKATLRAGISIARKLNEQAFDDGRDADDIIADLAAAVSELSKRSATVAVTSWASAFAKAMIPRDQTAGIQTGIKFLDDILSIRPKQLGIIAGRPGDGKSALATQILLGIAQNSEALLCSLEMSDDEVAQRMIAQMTGIEIDRIDALDFSPEERRRVTACREQLSLNFCATPTVSELRAVALVRKAQGRLKMIVVDYLQLLRVKRPSQSRTQDVTEISRDLKLLAMELDIPIIALSQFSRDAAREEPQLHHLRESGSIEQDADWILFAYADRTATEGGRKMIRLAKNRRGHCFGPFAVTFDGPTVRFGEATA